MKNTFISKVAMLCILFIVNANAFAQQFLTRIDGWNAYVHLPDEYYDSAHKSYPLICFLPGIGETGSDATKLLVHGPAKFIAAGHNMQFQVNGKVEKPIVIALQPAQNWTSPWQLNPKIDSILLRWRIDNQRINLTGLSMGGQAWQNYVAGTHTTFTSRPASMVIMSAPAPDNGTAKMALFAQAGGKWWGFEGTQDYRLMDQIRDTMNRKVAGSGRYTQYTGGHCCWNTWYNPDYNENGESIYTWMLKQRKPATPAAPLANAGRDTVVPVITPALGLRGSGNDPNGYPISFSWTKISGPTGDVINNSAIADPTINSLTAGTYKYELKVINNLGAIGRDTITIVNGLLLPVKLVTFFGFEKDGQIKLEWKTASELNSSHFEIERSSDGRTFSYCGRINAKGNSAVTVNYGFVDLLAHEGLNYYRLKMADIDGRFEYSNIITVTLRDKRSGSIGLTSSNFRNNTLQLNIVSAEEQVVQVFLIDLSGRVYLKSSEKLLKGMNNLSRNLFASKGMFYTKIVAGSEFLSAAIRHE